MESTTEIKETEVLTKESDHTTVASEEVSSVTSDWQADWYAWHQSANALLPQHLSNFSLQEETKSHGALFSDTESMGEPESEGTVDSVAADDVSMKSQTVDPDQTPEKAEEYKAKGNEFYKSKQILLRYLTRHCRQQIHGCN